jgi:hypothetical protein
MTVQRPYPPRHQPLPPPRQPSRPPASGPGVPPHVPWSPTGGWPVLLPPEPAGRRRRVWPWLLVVIVIVAVAVTAWVFLLAPTVKDGRQAKSVAIGASYSYPSGLVVRVSDINAYTSTNPSIAASGDTAYRGTVTLVNGSSEKISSALMTIAVATGTHSDDRIFENAPPPTQDIAPGQQLKVPFAFTVVKQASGPLQVTVTAVLDQPAIFTDATP